MQTEAVEQDDLEVPNSTGEMAHAEFVSSRTSRLFCLPELETKIARWRPTGFPLQAGAKEGTGL